MFKKMHKIVELNRHEELFKRQNADYYKTFDIGDILTVTEKLNGANVSFNTLGEVYSKNQKLSYDNSLRGFYNFVVENKLTEQTKQIFGKDIQVYGEWLVKHKGLKYKEDFTNCFYIFNIYDYEKEEFIGYTETVRKLQKLVYNNENVHFTPFLTYISFSSYKDLIMTQKCYEDKSHYTINGKMEGIVITDLDKKTPTGNLITVKIVSDKFKEKLFNVKKEKKH